MAGETQGSDPESLQGDDIDVEDDGADDDAVTAVQATRGREQGLGMGARELQMQRDVHVEQPDSDLARQVAPTNPELNASQVGSDRDVERK